MEYKELPQYVMIPLGIAFVVTALALFTWGIPMAIGKGSMGFSKKA
jgi:hypothetical protein